MQSVKIDLVRIEIERITGNNVHKRCVCDPAARYTQTLNLQIVTTLNLDMFKRLFRWTSFFVLQGHHFIQWEEEIHEKKIHLKATSPDWSCAAEIRSYFLIDFHAAND